MKRIFFLSCLVFWAVTITAQNADIDILRKINLHRPHILDRPFILLNDVNGPVCIALPASMFLAGLICKDSGLKYNAAETILALGFSGVVTEALKYLVDRPRPYVTYPDIQNVTKENDPSFPSEESTISFAMATSLSIHYPRWYVILPTYIWAATVAYSRMDMGVHYPSDVLAGSVIGAGSAWLSYQAGRWLNKCRHRTIKTTPY